MKIKKGKGEDLEVLLKILENVVVNMNDNKIFQWDKIYPNREVLEEDISKEELFVCYSEQEIPLGFVVLNEYQDEEYQLVEWSSVKGKQLVIHRLCVDPKWQGQGIAKKLLEFSKKYAEDNGYASIRLDAFIDNVRACRMYEKAQYVRRGTIKLRKGLFYCYEMIL